MASEKIQKAVKDASDELAKLLPPGAAEHSTLIIYAAGGSVALLTLRALTRKFYKCAAAARRARAACGGTTVPQPPPPSAALGRVVPLATATCCALPSFARVWCALPPSDARSGATRSTLAAPAR